jgi:hypothetical protein
MSITNLSFAGKLPIAALWSIAVSSTLMAQAAEPAFASYRLPSAGFWYCGRT